MIDREMIRDFLDEVEEHANAIEVSGLALEKDPENSDLVNDLFRAAHSIKGAAGYMGFERITELSHKMENLIELIRQKETSPTKEVMNVLFKALDRIRKLTSSLEKNGEETEKIEDIIAEIEGLVTRTRKVSGQEENSSASSKPVRSAGATGQGSSEPLSETYQQQIKKYVDSLCELVTSVDQGINPKESLTEMTSVIVDFLQLDSLPNETRVRQILENLAERLAEALEEDKTEPIRWSHELKPLVKDLIHALPDTLQPGDAIFAGHFVRPQNAPSGSDTSNVPEKEEGLFAFPLNEADRSLIDGFNEMDPEKTEQEAGGDSKDGAVINDELIDMALNSGDIEDELFSRDSQEGGKQEATGKEEEKKSCNTPILGTNGEPIIIDEEAVIHTIDENFTEEHSESSDNLSDEEGQIISEEYDQELFDIFLEAFKDNLDKLSRIEQDLRTGKEPSRCLDNALVRLEKMISSANYMDYQSVLKVLKTWRNEVKRLTLSDENIPSAFSKLFTNYCYKLLRLVPALRKLLEAQGQTSETLVALGETIDLSEVSSASAEVEIKIDTMFDLIESQKEETSAETVELNEEVKQFQAEIKLEAEREDGAELIEASEGEDDESEVSLTELVSKQTLRVDAQKVDNLLNQVGELVVVRAGFSQTADVFRETIRGFAEQEKLNKQDLKVLKNISYKIAESSVSLGRIANELQEAVMKIRMLPVHNLFQRFPRLVRNYSGSLNKRVELKIIGSDTELDKRVLEQMADPIVHLLRNAIAHGIEDPSTRAKLGKPEEGRITLSAYHEGNHVIIEISDDGQGINVEKLKEVLVEKNVISSADINRLSRAEILNSIFLPGISTAETVTSTSGRGVGMDIVKENVENLNGSIEVKSKQGEGTTFIIKIPLTVAIIQALLVDVCGQIFTIPLTSVLEITRVFEEEIETIEGFEVIHLRDTTIPLLRLENVLNFDTTGDKPGRTFVVIVSVGKEEVGLIVDGLLGEQEVVIKPLSESLRENRTFSGATILGDGSISLILDVAQLVEIVKGRSFFKTGTFTAAA